LFISIVFQGFLFGEKEVGGCGKISDKGVFGDAIVGSSIDSPIAGGACLCFHIEILGIAAGEAGRVVAVLLGVTAFGNDVGIAVFDLL
jgi:hypothetical protein